MFNNQIIAQQLSDKEQQNVITFSRCENIMQKLTLIPHDPFENQLWRDYFSSNSSCFFLTFTKRHTLTTAGGLWFHSINKLSSVFSTTFLTIFIAKLTLLNVHVSHIWRWICLKAASLDRSSWFNNWGVYIRLSFKSTNGEFHRHTCTGMSVYY